MTLLKLVRFGDVGITDFGVGADITFVALPTIFMGFVKKGLALIQGRTGHVPNVKKFSFRREEKPIFSSCADGVIKGAAVKVGVIGNHFGDAIIAHHVADGLECRFSLHHFPLASFQPLFILGKLVRIVGGFHSLAHARVHIMKHPRKFFIGLAMTVDNLTTEVIDERLVDRATGFSINCEIVVTTLVNFLLEIQHFLPLLIFVQGAQLLFPPDNNYYSTRDR